jgi:hypothetical protein
LQACSGELLMQAIVLQIDRHEDERRREFDSSIREALLLESLRGRVVHFENTNVRYSNMSVA